MKPLVVVSCPADTKSGYGARSRDILKAIIDMDKYDVRFISQRWGATQFGALDPANEDHKKILACVSSHEKNPITRQPDVWIQITVPNEFNPLGKYNIGITAGIETTLCDGSWIEGCNRMNLVLASSEHAKKVFETSSFEKRDNKTNVVTEIIKLKTKVEVLFEGVDLRVFKKLDTVNLDLSMIKEDFCFLTVGHWLQGDFNEDRKNISGWLKLFLEMFKNKKNKPALILKVSSATYSVMDRNEMLKKIDIIKKSVKGDLPNVYLFHGEYTNEELNELYNHTKVKAFVLLTKGEGYGRPYLEFSVSAKPVVASNYSGHLDFLNPDFNILVGGTIAPVHPSAVVQNMILAEAGWFNFDSLEASNKISNLYENYKNFTDGAKRQAYKSRTEFSLEKMEDKLKDIFERNLPQFSLPTEIKLPKLNKISLPPLKKV